MKSTNNSPGKLIYCPKTSLLGVILHDCDTTLRVEWIPKGMIQIRLCSTLFRGTTYCGDNIYPIIGKDPKCTTNYVAQAIRRRNEI